MANNRTLWHELAGDFEEFDLSGDILPNDMTNFFADDDHQIKEEISPAVASPLVLVPVPQSTHGLLQQHFCKFSLDQAQNKVTQQLKIKNQQMRDEIVEMSRVIQDYSLLTAPYKQPVPVPQHNVPTVVIKSESTVKPITNNRKF